jgi:hypothetical protein
MLNGEQMLNVTSTAIWIGHNVWPLTSLPFSIGGVGLLSELFLTCFSSAVDLLRITCLAFEEEYGNLMPSVVILKPFLDHMPSLRRIHLRGTWTSLEIFLLAMWSQSGPFDFEFSRRVDDLDIEVFGLNLDANAMGESLINHLKTRLYIVGLPLYRLKINLTTKGMSAKMKELALYFIHGVSLQFLVSLLWLADTATQQT